MRVTLTSSLAVLVAVVVCVYCQECVPDQWEGTQTTVSNYNPITKQDALHVEIMKVSYDATNSRVFASVEVDSEGSKHSYQFLQVYEGNGGKLYVFDPATKDCTVAALQTAFTKECITSDAKFQGDSFIGLTSEGYKVSQYVMEIKNDQADVVVASDVQKLADGTVMPVTETVLAKLNGKPAMQIIEITDAAVGIKDESVFTIPAECLSSSAYMMAVHRMSQKLSVFNI